MQYSNIFKAVNVALVLDRFRVGSRCPGLIITASVLYFLLAVLYHFIVSAFLFLFLGNPSKCLI